MDTSLSNLCHCLTVLTGKKKHNTKTPCPYILLQLMPVASYLPSLHTCAQGAALSAWWLQHRQWGLLLGPLKPFLPQAEQTQHLSLPLLMGQVPQDPVPISVFSTENIISVFPVLEGSPPGSQESSGQVCGSKMVCICSWIRWSVSGVAAGPISHMSKSQQLGDWDTGQIETE